MSSQPVAIRQARAADLDALHRIEVASFAAPWRRESFRDLVLGGRARVVVAVGPEGGVIGFGVLVAAADEAEVANLAVAPAARRAGVGRAIVMDLVTAAEAGGAHAVYLEVRESNVAARGLYAALGFVEVGRRRAYYHEPDEDALVMRRQAGRDARSGAMRGASNW